MLRIEILNGIFQIFTQYWLLWVISNKLKKKLTQYHSEEWFACLENGPLHNDFSGLISSHTSIRLVRHNLIISIWLDNVEIHFEFRFETWKSDACITFFRVLRRWFLVPCSFSPKASRLLFFFYLNARRLSELIAAKAHKNLFEFLLKKQRSVTCDTAQAWIKEEWKVNWFPLKNWLHSF